MSPTAGVEFAAPRFTPFDRAGSIARWRRGPSTAIYPRPMSRRARLAATTLTSWVRDLSSVAKDRILALLLALLAVVEVVTAEAVVGSRWLQAIALVVMTASVAWRRASPVLAGAVAGAALGAQTLLGEADVVAGFVALMIVTYSAASYAPLRRALVGGTFVAGGVFVYPIVGATTFAEEAGNLAIFAGMWVLGRMVRSRQMRAVEAEARARAVEQDREERIRAVIAEERSRMARELHDIVAHGVSLMVLQAGAARQTLDTAPAAVPDLLMTIERAGRQSLDEMHRLLALLRHDDESLAPSPRLDALDGCSMTSGAPACASSSASRASRDAFRLASRSPPTGSCRSRSPTPCATRRPRRRASSSATTSMRWSSR